MNQEIDTILNKLIAKYNSFATYTDEGRIYSDFSGIPTENKFETNFIRDNKVIFKTVERKGPREGYHDEIEIAYNSKRPWIFGMPIELWELLFRNSEIVDSSRSWTNKVTNLRTEIDNGEELLVLSYLRKPILNFFMITECITTDVFISEETHLIKKIKRKDPLLTRNTLFHAKCSQILYNLTPYLKKRYQRYLNHASRILAMDDYVWEETVLYKNIQYEEKV